MTVGLMRSSSPSYSRLPLLPHKGYGERLGDGGSATGSSLFVMPPGSSSSLSWRSYRLSLSGSDAKDCGAARTTCWQLLQPLLVVEAHDEFSFGNGRGDEPNLSKLGSNSTAELHPKGGAQPAAMPPASVMMRLILLMVWRMLIRNPNTYSSLIGLVWSLVSFSRWGVEMPDINAGSFLILSNAGLGMTMFSLGASLP